MTGNEGPSALVLHEDGYRQVAIVCVAPRTYLRGKAIKEIPIIGWHSIAGWIGIATTLQCQTKKEPY